MYPRRQFTTPTGLPASRADRRKDGFRKVKERGAVGSSLGHGHEADSEDRVLLAA
jgi:hypothetical protein